MIIIINTGHYTVPQVFFNSRLIGGYDELMKLDQLGSLHKLIQECLNDCDVDFPPPYRRPESKEFLKVID